MLLLKRLLYGILLLLLISSCEEDIQGDLNGDILYTKKYELTYSKPLKLDTFQAELRGEDLDTSVLHFTITRYDGVLLYEEYVDAQSILGDGKDLDSLDVDSKNRLVHSRVDNFLQDKSELIILFEKLRPQVKDILQ